MNQDKKQDNMGQGQGGMGQQGQQNQNKQSDRGNPSTTERVQPNQGGQQRQDGDRQGSQQTKF